MVRQTPIRFYRATARVFRYDSNLPPHGLSHSVIDEQLQYLLLVRINHPTEDSSADPNQPPSELLSFLAHIQVSLEATYISSVPVPSPDPVRSTRLSAPPRTASLATKPKTRLGAHPSIFPPNTPNPTPSSADHDRRYATSEGTLLLASIWGQNSSNEIREGFILLWSSKEKIWVAVYQLGLTVCESLSFDIYRILTCGYV